MGKKSAGLLVFRIRQNDLQIFLMHPGGPFFARKDLGAWSIPKGEIGENENEAEAAKREFEEETGFQFKGDLISLKPIKQKSGKTVVAWATEQDFDVSKIKSNLFEMEWPPKSGKYQQFPEMDRAEWFSVSDAKEKIIPGQNGLIEELEDILINRSPGPDTV
jgi:predicted NUDIX family NTP pyrophosphohydrolase